MEGRKREGGRLSYTYSHTSQAGKLRHRNKFHMLPKPLHLPKPPLMLRSLDLFLPTDENCKDRYYNCNVVVQARLCVYNYYKTACCASCTRVANRHLGFLGGR